MINLLELKHSVIRQLSEHWKNVDFEAITKDKKRFVTYKFKIEQTQLSNLLGHVIHRPLNYFKSKDGKKEILGIGSHITYTKKYDYNKLLGLIEQHEDLIFLGAQRFSQSTKRDETWTGFDECHFSLPKLVFETSENQTVLKVIFNKKSLTSEDKRANALFELEAYLNFIRHEFAVVNTCSTTTYPEKSHWDKMMKACMDNLEKTPLEKVVLARKEIIEFDRIVDPMAIFEKNIKNAPDSYHLYLDPGDGKVFMSFTPEKLFKAKDREISLDCLAGTRPRSNDFELDLKYQSELTSSPKELEEHRIVSREIQEKLSMLGAQVKIEAPESVLKLKYIQHIHTHIVGTLSEKSNFAVLLNTLHPTPAVGGRPWVMAKKCIDEIEPFDRGLYAGPMGYISSDSCEFAVAIRSALSEETKLHVFGGCGLVTGSDTDSEWLESKNKMKIFEQPTL
ncbi:isochorismate synthase MenF [Halobacteriovorax sp. HLS]|uniref:isochorismate synthase n=1 Tax=Halobacteriovorax sp. HLS TaxID=2234000 RepID=UPI000FDC90B4|nr:isochorismate synthase [Halobacteriovorax sp. HLS]